MDKIKQIIKPTTPKKMSILKLLASQNFITVNKALIKAYGLEAAVLLGLFAGYSGHFADASGWFYREQSDIEEETGLSAKTQLKAVRVLEESGLLETTFAGVPRKKFFRLNEEMILKTFNTAELPINSQKEIIETPKGRLCNLPKGDYIYKEEKNIIKENIYTEGEKLNFEPDPQNVEHTAFAGKLSFKEFFEQTEKARVAAKFILDTYGYTQAIRHSDKIKTVERFFYYMYCYGCLKKENILDDVYKGLRGYFNYDKLTGGKYRHKLENLLGSRTQYYLNGEWTENYAEKCVRISENQNN